jgi:DNA-binding NtrC family response regulator
MSARTSGERKVLLIDDDEVIAGSLRQYLTMQNCDVDVAVDPHKAKALMRASAYDTIVIDPYLTGAVHAEQSALLDAVAALQPQALTIVLTAYASPELMIAAAGCKSAAVLSKPQSVVFLSELVLSPQPAALNS